MKRVMLVDDEVLIRESIRSCIHWEREGFIYCGDASDGEVALPLIEEWRPDILITDIKMPFMDGLQLTSFVRGQFPDIKIIILTGHDEFRFAQNALRLGVEDYCLKPVTPEDLVAMLKKVRDKLDKENETKARLAYSRDNLLVDLCGGLLNTSEAMDIAAELSIPLTAKYYAVLVADLRQGDIKGCLRLGSHILSFTRSRTEQVYIFKGSSETALRNEMDEAAAEIRAYADRLPDSSLFIGIGSVQQRLQGIHISYVEAEEDKLFNRLAKQNKDKLRGMPYIPEQALVDREKLFHFIKLGVPADMQSFLTQFCIGLKDIDWQLSSYGYYLLNDITLDAIRVAKQTFRSAYDPADSLSDLQAQVSKVNSHDGMMGYLRELIEHLWKLRSDSSDKYGDMIDKVRDYINRHYHNNQFGLKDMAEHVCVSPSHLSKIYSQETGQTLTEYLTQTRMKKAMELLSGTNQKTFEIAYDVGYSDHHYFSNLFKKITGMTPTEYRKQRA